MSYSHTIHLSPNSWWRLPSRYRDQLLYRGSWHILSDQTIAIQLTPADYARWLRRGEPLLRQQEVAR